MRASDNEADFLTRPAGLRQYTIAKELEARIGCRVFHNHLTIEAAKPIFEFGSADFWQLVLELRLTCLKAAAIHGVGTLVYTSCYDQHDLGFLEEIEEALRSSGAELLPVYLQCEVSELERRVMDATRIGMGKVRSVEGLHKTLACWKFVAVPRSNCVTVRTDGKTPAECAEEIIDLLGVS